MAVGQVVLGLGTFAAIGSYAVAGRLVALLVTALWSVGTAYLFMAPAYSFQVSETSDIVALVLYGAFGLVLARTTQKTRLTSNAASVNSGGSDAAQGDLAGVLAELMSSSQMENNWGRSGISLRAAHLENFRCARADGVRVLSDVLSAVGSEAGIRHVSLHAARRPSESLLFIDVYRTGVPSPKTMSMRGSAEPHSVIYSNAWPEDWKVCRFEYAWGAVYRVSLDRAS